MRKDATQLPGQKELGQILDQEASREVAVGKTDIHYPDFSSMLSLLEHFGLDSSPFKSTYSRESIETGKLMVDMNELISKAVPEILKCGQASKKYFDDIYDYLSEEETPQKSDLIFVFGSQLPARTEKAIELFKAGMAPKIMISGKGPIYKENTQSEACHWRDFAVERGVPREAIIIENKSITIPDNVKASLNYLDKESLPVQSFILVNSPFSQRRGWCHFKKYTDSDVPLYRVNAEISDDFIKSNWYKNERGIKVYINEFVKMKISVELNSA